MCSFSSLKSGVFFAALLWCTQKAGRPYLLWKLQEKLLNKAESWTLWPQYLFRKSSTVQFQKINKKKVRIISYLPSCQAHCNRMKLLQIALYVGHYVSILQRSVSTKCYGLVGACSSRSRETLCFKYCVLYFTVIPSVKSGECLDDMTDFNLSHWFFPIAKEVKQDILRFQMLSLLFSYFQFKNLKIWS